MPKTYYSLYVHLIWRTKKREFLLEKSWRLQLFEFIRNHADLKHGIHVDFINGVEDHVHAIIFPTPSQSIAKIAKVLKGASSRWINESGLVEGDFQWQKGYAAFSFSGRQLQQVRNYIANQEEHHKQFGFDTELQDLTEMASRVNNLDE